MISKVKKLKRLLTKDSIAVFDFDYTLAETSECVLLKAEYSDNYYRLTPKEYLERKESIKDKLDENAFVEFDDIDLNNIHPIGQSLRLMERLYNQGCSIVILSARPQKVENKIRKFMLDFSSVQDYQFIGLGSGNPMRKIDFIEQNGNDNSWLIEDNIYCIAKCSIFLPFQINYGYVVKGDSQYKVEMYYNRKKYEL